MRFFLKAATRLVLKSFSSEMKNNEILSSSIKIYHGKYNDLLTLFSLFRHLFKLCARLGLSLLSLDWSNEILTNNYKQQQIYLQIRSIITPTDIWEANVYF